MTTLSISLDTQLKQEIEQFSKEDGVSKSVIVRRLLKQAAWERTWRDMAGQIRTKLDALDLTDPVAIEHYLG